MRYDKQAEAAYAFHSAFAKDEKDRRFVGIMENIRDDLELVQKLVATFESKKFDFVASCRWRDVPSLRVFDARHVYRIGIDTKKISISEVHRVLVNAGWLYMSGNNGGPLKLSDVNFKTGYRVTLFRMREPFVDFYRYVRIYFSI